MAQHASCMDKNSGHRRRSGNDCQDDLAGIVTKIDGCTEEKKVETDDGDGESTQPTENNCCSGVKPCCLSTEKLQGGYHRYWQ